MTFDIIRAYSDQRIDLHQLLRALISHDGWFAPAELAATVFRRTDFEHLCIGTLQFRRPKDQLWLFTSIDEVSVAQQQSEAQTRKSIGPYVGPLSGVDLFESLAADLTALRINVSNPVEALRFEGRFLHAARLWGRALALERAIDRRDSDQLVHMVGYDHFCVLAHSSHRLATASVGGSQAAMVFTAPDAAALAIAGMPEPRPKIGTFTGRTLFPIIAAMQVDGVVLNLGPRLDELLPR